MDTQVGNRFLRLKQGNEMNNLNELSILIAERVKHTLGPEELLKIDSDTSLHSIILDAAGHVIGVLFDQMRNNIKVNLIDRRRLHCQRPWVILLRDSSKKH